MMRDNRIRYFAAADYTEGSELDRLVRAIIDRTAANEALESVYFVNEKERKEAAAQVGDVRRKRYCQVCGKEINVYDGDILEYDNGFVICEECRQKALKNNQ